MDALSGGLAITSGQEPDHDKIEPQPRPNQSIAQLPQRQPTPFLRARAITRLRGALILARQINPFCTPQPENAERSETAHSGGSGAA